MLNVCLCRSDAVLGARLLGTRLAVPRLLFLLIASVHAHLYKGPRADEVLPLRDGRREGEENKMFNKETRKENKQRNII